MKKIKDIFYYFQGNIRYEMYYSKYKKYIPKHVLQQIEHRLLSMDKECFETGSCKLCGCTTTALQMCNKACDKPCYPEMIKRHAWNKLKSKDSSYHVDNTGIWNVNQNGFKKIN